MAPQHPVCPACLRPVCEATDFCPGCGLPLSPLAASDPARFGRAEGEMVRRAMRRPSRLILIGVWLLYGLPCLLFLGWFVELVGEDSRDPLKWLIALVFLGGGIAVYLRIVWRVTRGYWTRAK